ncbi:flagellar biosynthesis protein FliQ [Clostridium sp. DL1XJH146]
MSETMALDILKDAFFTIAKVAGPILIIALLVGLIISIVQATTQIQEQTLTFVPKILAVFLALIIFGNYMLNTMIGFFTRTMGNISNILR